MTPMKSDIHRLTPDRVAGARVAPAIVVVGAVGGIDMCD